MKFKIKLITAIYLILNIFTINCFANSNIIWDPSTQTGDLSNYDIVTNYYNPSGLKGKLDIHKSKYIPKFNEGLTIEEPLSHVIACYPSYSYNVAFPNYLQGNKDMIIQYMSPENGMIELTFGFTINNMYMEKWESTYVNKGINTITFPKFIPQNANDYYQLVKIKRFTY